MSGKTSFVMHTRHIDVLADFSDGDFRRIVQAIAVYVEKGIEPDFSDNPGLQMAFRFLRIDLNRDAAKWEETKAKRIEAGRQGGLASAESRRQAKQT